MRIAVWKYPLEYPTNDLELPRGAEIVHVHEQAGNPTIWAEVDPGEPPEHRRFAVVMTGQTMYPETSRYIHLGTCHLPNGIVAHVYEIVVTQLESNRS